MSVLAIIAALLLEQWRPLADRRMVFAPLAGWANALERAFNAGEARQGTIAWVLAVVPAVAIAVIVHSLLHSAGSLFALAFDIAVLYLTLGFRQFSHAFTAIQTAIKAGELHRARTLLAGWRDDGEPMRNREEVIRLTIEEALLASHRYVFGVLFWYVLLPGPSGAILYRLAAFLRRRWGGTGAFGVAAERTFHLLEWPAVRLTAAAFAVAGDFEDAVYCWRTQARGWFDPDAGVVLAAGAGAMGVRLGLPRQSPEGVVLRPEIGLGEAADGPHLDSTVGLLWRALVVWVFVLALAAAAHHLA